MECDCICTRRPEQVQTELPLDLTEVPGTKQCFCGRGCHHAQGWRANCVRDLSVTAVQLAIGQCLETRRVPDLVDSTFYISTTG